MEHIEKLQQMNACRQAVEWARKFKSAQAAWNVCGRPDWMCFWLRKTVTCEHGSATHRALVRVAARCAMLAPEIADAGSELARQWACDAALRFGMGEDNREEADAAYAAAYAADAAYAAAYAAYAAYAAAYAADAADAADAAYAAYAARAKIRATCCDIIREEFPSCP